MTRINLKYILVVGLLLLGIWSCVDEIDLPGTRLDRPTLAVQARLITGDTSFIEVEIDWAADFAVSSVPDPVSGAQVMVSSEGNQQQMLVESEAGVYTLDGDQLALPLNYGTQYRIDINLADGSAYQSDWETLLPAPQPDSVSVEVLSREVLGDNDVLELKNFIRFFVSTPLDAGSGDRSYLKWDLESIYRLDERAPPPNVPGPGPATCFITRPLNLREVLVFDGNENNGDQLVKFLIAEEEIDTRFSLGFLLNVTQESLNQGAFNYWDQVGKTVGVSGGLFEPTPGKIQGNISNLNDPEEDVFGYFYVTEQKLVQGFVDPDVVGRPQPLCAPNSFSAGSTACDDCLLLPRSTTVIPEGWGE